MTISMLKLADSELPSPSTSGIDESYSDLRIDQLRILWVKVGGLWPLNSGGRLRSFHLINELSKHNEMTVITTHTPSEDPQALAAQLTTCRAIRSIPYTPAKKHSLRFLLALARSLFTRLPVDLHKNRIPALGREVASQLESGQFDICIADFLVAVPNLPRNLKTPILFFEHNVEFMIWKRLQKTQNSLIGRALLGLEWRKMRRYEHDACERAGVTVAVSEDDRKQLALGAPNSRIEAIPTGVDVDYFKPGDIAQEIPTELVFTGSMDWHPNEDAMLYFIDKILPLVRRQYPQITVTMVGRNPSESLRKAAVSANVRLTGTVADVRPYIERAAIYIVPLRIGGGTRLKIYEALAMGKPVVSTTIGAEGLPLEEGKHILRADDPESFSQAIFALLGNQNQRLRMARYGRELMEQEYSWRRVAGDFERICRSLAKHRGT